MKALKIAEYILLTVIFTAGIILDEYEYVFIALMSMQINISLDILKAIKGEK